MILNRLSLLPGEKTFGHLSTILKLLFIFLHKVSFIPLVNVTSMHTQYTPSESLKSSQIMVSEFLPTNNLDAIKGDFSCRISVE